MKNNKKLFTYKNKIILTNGSSLRITSVKYIKNYQLNIDIVKQINKNNHSNNISNQNKFKFIKKVINY